MPPGLTFTGATRTFSGTPTQAGVFAVTVSATDSGTPALTATNSFNITVTPATLTITADAKVKTYGAADPLLTFLASGLKFSDTPASVLTGALARVAGETVAGSPYAITQGTLAANGNYAISFTGNSLAITPASLTVTADAKTKSFGTADPPFTASFAGFVNGESPAVLGGTLSLTRAPGESVGTYPITPSGLTSANYAITFNPGLLTITGGAAPVVLSLGAQDAATVLLSWNAVSNVTYRVQFKADLRAITWTDLPGDVTASGTTTSKTDAKIATGRFYRAQVLP